MSVDRASRSVKVATILNTPKYKKSYMILKQYIASTLLLAVGNTVFLVFLVFVIWSKFGKTARATKHISGSTIKTTAEVKKYLKKHNLIGNFRIGDMPLIKDTETRHFLIIGSTGSGKTNLINTLLLRVRDAKHPAIILDQTGEMIERYYDPNRGDKEISNILPNMAKHIDDVYQEKLQALNNAHNDTVAANKELTSVFDQKLDEYSKKLSDSASYVTQCSNTSFLKNMCLVVLFSAIISGGTAYLVTTKFPRYLTVTGANNVTIQDCDVSILGKAKDNDNLMEKMTRKKLPQKN